MHTGGKGGEGGARCLYSHADARSASAAARRGREAVPSALTAADVTTDVETPDTVTPAAVSASAKSGSEDSPDSRLAAPALRRVEE